MQSTASQSQLVLFFLGVISPLPYLSGELQFAFVCFLLGNVYEAFEHWKRLLNLLCRAEEAMVKHHTLYINLISILYHQLGEIPADFFVDIVSQNNFLTSTLQVSSVLHPRKACLCVSCYSFVTQSFLNFSFLILGCFLVLSLLLDWKLLDTRDPLSVPPSPHLPPECLALGCLEFESPPPL